MAISAHIKDHYSVVKVLPGVMIFKGETIDLRTISKAKADEIYEAGFKYLKKKRKSRGESSS